MSLPLRDSLRNFFQERLNPFKIYFRISLFEKKGLKIIFYDFDRIEFGKEFQKIEKRVTGKV